MLKYLTILSLTAALNAAPPRPASSGCVQTTTVTVESESCLQLDCVEQGANGGCALKECARTQKKKYADPSASGCSRVVNCGKGSYFISGTAEEPETESTEICDWRACVESDAQTGACTSYQCLSRRTIQAERVSYTGARCVKRDLSRALEVVRENTEATQPFTPTPVGDRLKGLAD